MSRDVSLLHPKLQTIIAKIEADCKNANLPILITETFRTKAEQDKLYAQGRTTSGNIVTNVKYPNSAHCWGIAFDFCRNVKGREYDDSDNFFKKVADIAKRYGLSWGGDWKSFIDKPHLELPEYSSVNKLISLYGTPDNFIKSWKNIPNEKEGNEMRYKTVNDVPEWAKPLVYDLMGRNIIAGDGNKDLQSRVIDLSEDMLRTLAFCDRMIKENK